MKYHLLLIAVNETWQESRMSSFIFIKFPFQLQPLLMERVCIFLWNQNILQIQRITLLAKQQAISISTSARCWWATQWKVIQIWDFFHSVLAALLMILQLMTQIIQGFMSFSVTLRLIQNTLSLSAKWIITVNDSNIARFQLAYT